MVLAMRHCRLMGEESQHPITTPKGASLLTVILAVIGVFTPFFTSLQAAQLFSVVAVMVIVWIYWGEVRQVSASRSGISVLILPVAAIVIIGGVVIGATWLVDSRPPLPPAITVNDVTSAIDGALKRNQPIVPPPLPPAHEVVVRQVSPIIIKEAGPAPIVSNGPRIISANSPELIENFKKKSARLNAQYDAEIECSISISRTKYDLNQFINEAVAYQNAYYYGHNDKKMTSDLTSWSESVEKYFVENKKILPDVTLFQLANEGQSGSTFLGIHQSGKRAWASMEAKKKVLVSIDNQVSNRPCSLEGAGAVMKCEADKTC